MTSPVDYYAVLGVTRGVLIQDVLPPFSTVKKATPSTIKAAYREKILKHHPDKSGNSEMCDLLSKAQDVLLDPHKKDVYDKSGVKGLEYMEQRKLANKDISSEKVLFSFAASFSFLFFPHY
jgi:DnaJ-class molecular chaperone